MQRQTRFTLQNAVEILVIRSGSTPLVRTTSMPRKVEVGGRFKLAPEAAYQIVVVAGLALYAHAKDDESEDKRYTVVAPVATRSTVKRSEPAAAPVRAPISLNWRSPPQHSEAS